jgi:hypothetical protein
MTDILTGLVWRRCLEGMVWNDADQTCNGTPLHFGWKESLAHARANKKGGWRVPNVKELVSIVDFETSFPALNQQAFPNGFANTLSSTAVEINGDRLVGYVSYQDGSVFSNNIRDSQQYSLRLVSRGRE